MSTQAFGACRLTERSRPGPGKEIADTVRKNDLVQASNVHVGLKRRYMYI